MHPFEEEHMRTITGTTARLTLFVAALFSAPGMGAAQEPVDIATMVVTSLTEFETTNGPIVEVQAQALCRDAGATEEEPCLHPEVDAVMERFAQEAGANLGAVGAPLPTCRWNEVATADRAGVRLSATVGHGRDRTLWVTVAVRCAQDPGRIGTEFVHAVRYPFQQVEGEWSRAGEAITIVSESGVRR